MGAKILAETSCRIVRCCPKEFARWQVSRRIVVAQLATISSLDYIPFARTGKGSPAVFLMETIELPFTTLNVGGIGLAAAITFLHR